MFDIFQYLPKPQYRAIIRRGAVKPPLWVEDDWTLVKTVNHPGEKAMAAIDQEGVYAYHMDGSFEEQIHQLPTH